MIFYPSWLLEAEQNIVSPILGALEGSIIDIIVQGLIVGLLTTLPLISLIYFNKNLIQV